MGRAAAAEFGSGSCCDRRCLPGGPRACAPTSRRSSGSSSLTCAVASGLCHTSGSPICWTYTMRAASLHGCEAGSRPHDGDGSQQHRPPSRRGPWPHSGGLELPRLVSRLWDFSAPAESQTGANPAQSKGIRDESADSNPPICGPFRALCAMTGSLRIVVSPVRVRVSPSARGDGIHAMTGDAVRTGTSPGLAISSRRRHPCHDRGRRPDRYESGSRHQLAATASMP
jgi:hypothetical protein